MHKYILHQISDVLVVCGPRLSLNLIESLLLLRELPYSVRSSGDVLRTGLLAPLEKSSEMEKKKKKENRREKRKEEIKKERKKKRSKRKKKRRKRKKKGRESER